jgi:D-glycero-D-manno-heptose 1,7-bisphosphate phosphatase
MSARAILLDRDGTVIHAKHYPSRPDEIVLYDGLAPEMAALKASGFRLVLVTNQSGLARGYFDASDLTAMHDCLQTQLASHGAELDAIYFCPHHPEGALAELAVECNCRKPKPGMLVQAARDLNLDLAQSWMVGDILDDIEAGNRAGCRTILVDLGTESPPAQSVRRPDYIARDTRHALRIVRSLDAGGSAVDLDYRPAGWIGSAPVAHGQSTVMIGS